MATVPYLRRRSSSCLCLSVHAGLFHTIVLMKLATVFLLLLSDIFFETSKSFIGQQ